MTSFYVPPTPPSIGSTATSQGWAANTSSNLDFLAGGLAFRASIKTATAIPANANINFNAGIIEDPTAGWNTVNHYYKIPFAGRWWVNAQVKWNAAPLTAGGVMNFWKTGVRAAQSTVFPTSVSGGASVTTYHTFATNDTVALAVTQGFTTLAELGDNNFFELIWLGL